MAHTNRASLIAKAHRVLKQSYKATSEEEERPLLEQMLFACCLENAPYETAAKAYHRLRDAFFDWNEVRVSTVSELAEVLRELPEAEAAAANVKRVLQGVFESTYSFDLEPLKKQNIGLGVKRLEELEGATPFVVAYTVQTALAGHHIPLDRGALEVLYLMGIATREEVGSGSVSGLERAIPKNKGIEFGGLLHQLAADYVANPQSPQVRKALLAVNPSAKDLIPKRGGLVFPSPPGADGKGSKKSARKPEETPAESEKSGGKKKRPEGKEAESKEAEAKEGGKGHEAKGADGKGHESKSTDRKAAPPKAREGAKKGGESADKGAKKRSEGEHGKSKSSAKSVHLSAKKKPASKQLAKRKPK